MATSYVQFLSAPWIPPVDNTVNSNNNSATSNTILNASTLTSFPSSTTFGSSSSLTDVDHSSSSSSGSYVSGFTITPFRPHKSQAPSKHYYHQYRQQNYLEKQKSIPRRSGFSVSRGSKGLILNAASNVWRRRQALAARRTLAFKPKPSLIPTSSSTNITVSASSSARTYQPIDHGHGENRGRPGSTSLPRPLSVPTFPTFDAASGVRSTVRGPRPLQPRSRPLSHANATPAITYKSYTQDTPSRSRPRGYHLETEPQELDIADVERGPDLPDSVREQIRRSKAVGGMGLGVEPSLLGRKIEADWEGDDEDNYPLAVIYSTRKLKANAKPPSPTKLVPQDADDYPSFAPNVGPKYVAAKRRNTPTANDEDKENALDSDAASVTSSTSTKSSSSLRREAVRKTLSGAVRRIGQLHLSPSSSDYFAAMNSSSSSSSLKVKGAKAKHKPIPEFDANPGLQRMRKSFASEPYNLRLQHSSGKARVGEVGFSDTMKRDPGALSPSSSNSNESWSKTLTLRGRKVFGMI